MIMPLALHTSYKKEKIIRGNYLSTSAPWLIAIFAMRRATGPNFWGKK